MGDFAAVHGIAIMSVREGLAFETEITSDTAPLNGLVQAMLAHPLGQAAAIIGEVVADHRGYVTMKTRGGGNRVVDMLSGEQLPRIC